MVFLIRTKLVCLSSGALCMPLKPFCFRCWETPKLYTSHLDFISEFSGCLRVGKTWWFFSLCVRWMGFSSLEKWLFLTWFLIGEVTYFKCHYLAGAYRNSASVLYGQNVDINLEFWRP